MNEKGFGDTLKLMIRNLASSRLGEVGSNAGSLKTHLVAGFTDFITKCEPFDSVAVDDIIARIKPGQTAANEAFIKQLLRDRGMEEEFLV